MGYIQITAEERHCIYHLKKQGLNQSDIARALDRSPASISRELHRNSGKRGYRPLQAHQQALSNRQCSSRNTRLTSEDFSLVRRYIEQDWSPEQVSAVLSQKHHLFVSHERIYQFLLHDKKEGGTLYHHLRCGQRRRKKRYGSHDRRGRIPNTTSIDERPAIVDTKERIGDWEIDTVIGENHRQAFVTLNERKTGISLIGKVASKHTDIVISQAIKLLLPYKKWVHTITADNGKEFAQFKDLEKSLQTKVYFAHPYSSWERGANENMNGLIRQYYPKKSSFVHVTQDDCNKTADLLNKRPRKRLGFISPAEIFKRITRKDFFALQG